ncbi:PA1136 family autoinducer-binding transcriptional regulator [Paracoccus maritimus]|uniref:PA1136 family autoinducer-binding transcriptional regulator n=1 Tax=Paracoccus maritimus TaxID=2933292 RepID=UPI0021A34759|nr:PA1136 family autoinducer-binding transcriptional regulator [Paracoccus sp. YLB-12]
MLHSASAEDAFLCARACAGAESLDRLCALVRDFSAPMGYDRFLIFSASANAEDPIDRIYWVEGDWFEDGSFVDADAYVRRCPVNRHVTEVREPFFWTKTRDSEGERYRIARHPRGRGVHGLQVPVFGPAGLEGAISFGGLRIDTSFHTQLAMEIIARAAFVAMRARLEGPNKAVATALTDRERQVLTWIAVGRRHVEIAGTLGLSERTIENHLRRIRKRLGVTTTAQAVHVAIRAGEILQ